MILLWVLSTWILGWLALPVTRRLFANFPDGGLAIGRTLSIVISTIVAMWLATLHVAPLSLAPLWLFGLPLLIAILALRRPAARRELVEWARRHKTALIASDAIYLVAFAAFLWVRMRWPDINNLEKSMDAGLIGVLIHTDYLPADSFWFSGTPFTNYYYFGHLMGALFARTLGTTTPYAFNLVQPLFCALFVAPLWSLCTALTGNWRRGAVAMSMVALIGHWEPLRQFYELWTTGKITAVWYSDLRSQLFNPMWWLQNINWWSTSRVIPDGATKEGTINEYPAFTLLIGDVHAHFFALALAAIFFALCFALFAPPSRTHISLVRYPTFPIWLDRRRCILVLMGVVLGAIWMTNTWDLPTYGLLGIGCAWFSGRRAPPTANAPDATKIAANIVGGVDWLWILLPFPIAALVAWPYSHLYKAPIKGLKFELWMPGPEMLYLWIGFLVLWVICLEANTKTTWYRRLSAFFPVVLIADGLRAYFTGVLYRDLVFALCMMGLTILSLPWSTAQHAEAEAPPPAPPARTFGNLMGACGFLALMAPMLFYIVGFFGPGYLHQDTVFKFTLQAWLLLGTAASCGAIVLLCSLPQAVWRWRLGAAWAVLWIIPVACSLAVLRTRTVKEAPGLIDGSYVLSLNGARHVSPDEQKVLAWIEKNARPGETVLEAAPQQGGQISGDYLPQFGRVAALTGVPEPLGWPQHVMYWGADWGKEVMPRWNDVQSIYTWRDEARARRTLQRLGVTYLLVGETERLYYRKNSLARLAEAFPVAYSSGPTILLRVR